MEKKTNNVKLEIFKFLRISASSQVIAFDKIGGNYALSTDCIEICLLGYFACRIDICDENNSKSYDFREKCKRIEKSLDFFVISVNVLRFSLKLLIKISKKVRKYVF